MNITSKSRYAMKIVMDLAHYQELGVVKRTDIVKRQGIPAKYLDQIMIKLRASGVVKSTRGREGGYRLAVAADDLSVFDIMASVEENFLPAECAEDNKGCDFEPSCVSSDVWKKIFAEIKYSMKKLTLSSFMHDPDRVLKMCPLGGLKECRPGQLNKENLISIHH